MIQVLKKTWRQRLLSLLLPILLVFAMAGVGMKVPVQAAGNDTGAQTGSPFSGCGSGAVHSGPVGRKDDDL